MRKALVVLRLQAELRRLVRRISFVSFPLSPCSSFCCTPIRAYLALSRAPSDRPTLPHQRVLFPL